MSEIKVFLIGMMVFVNFAQAKDVNIAIVLDGVNVNRHQAFKLIRNNIKKVMSRPSAIKLKKRNIYYEGLNELKLIKRYKKLVKRKDIDLIIAIGPIISSYVASKLVKVKKPTIAAPIYDNDIRKKKNMNSIHIFPSIQEIKKHIKLLDPGKNVLFVGRDYKGFKKYYAKIEGLFGDDYIVDFYKTGGEYNPPDLSGVDFIVYFPFSFDDESQFRSFQATATEKKIKTYSPSGIEALNEGVLYSTEIKNWKVKVARMIAINLMDFSNGRRVEKLKTHFLSFDKLSYSLDIAKKLGITITNLSFTPYKPSVKKVLGTTPKLNLESAVDNAIEENLDYLVQKYQEKVADYNEGAALGKIFPQINFNMEYNQRQKNRTVAFLGISEKVTTLGVTGEQVIFNDDIFNKYAVAGYFFKRRKYLKQQAEIDLINTTLNAYLKILRAASFLKIREENLRVTTENLDIATLKYKSGKGAKTEIYRWESEVAQNKNMLTRSTVNLRNSFHLLNRLMNQPLDKNYRLDKFEEIYNKLISMALHKYSESKEIRVLENYISFLIDEARAKSPHLKSLNEGVNVQQREMLNQNRSFYLPKIKFVGNYQYWIDRSGEGSEGDIAANAGALWKDYWQIGLRLDFPIFDGTSRLSERKAQVNRLYRAKARKSSGNLKNDQNIRDQVYRIRGALDQVKYNKEFEIATKKNLDLVRLSYKTGRVDILRLLDAQNFWIRAREALTASQIAALFEFTNLEDKVGYFWFRLSTQERLNLETRFRSYMARL